MFRISRFLDEGESGGTPGSEGTPGGEAGPGSADANADPSGDKNVADAGDKIPEFKNLDAAKEFITKLHGDHTKLTGEHGNLKTKVGDQGRKLGAFEAYQKGLVTDPKGTLAAMAKNAGLDINFGEKTGEGMSMEALITKAKEGEPSEQAGILEAMQKLNQKSTAEAISSAVSPLANQQVEMLMASKYTDWAEGMEDRATVKAELDTGAMNAHELLHLAARGKRADEIAGVAKKAGYAQAETDMSRKQHDGLASPGTASSKEETDASDKAKGIAFKGMANA